MFSAPRKLIIHPVPAEQQVVLDRITDTLQSKGYAVEKVMAGWVKVSKDETTVQLEVDNPGANLDIVLLSEETDQYDSAFPLGGSWATKSSVKVTEGNERFAVARVEAFFGTVAEGDDMNARVWETVQRRDTGF